MTINEQRVKINALYDQLVAERQIPISASEETENEVNDQDLLQHGIYHVSCDLNTLDGESSNLQQDPPFLFHPLPSRFFQEHPINPLPFGIKKHQEKVLLYHEYTGPIDRAESHPDPFLLRDGEWTGVYSTDGDSWYSDYVVGCVSDDGQRLPHIICTVVQSFDGKEDTMLFDELVPILWTMRNRANQVKVDRSDEEAQEALYHKTEEELGSMPLEFDMERRFPVLILSFVGPQHGRLFYACMDGEKLVVRQSKNYSFEKTDTALWDLFARFLMSRPLRENI